MLWDLPFLGIGTSTISFHQVRMPIVINISKRARIGCRRISARQVTIAGCTPTDPEVSCDLKSPFRWPPSFFGKNEGGQRMSSSSKVNSLRLSLRKTSLHIRKVIANVTILLGNGALKALRHPKFWLLLDCKIWLILNEKLHTRPALTWTAVSTVIRSQQQY